MSPYICKQKTKTALQVFIIAVEDHFLGVKHCFFSSFFMYQMKNKNKKSPKKAFILCVSYCRRWPKGVYPHPFPSFSGRKGYSRLSSWAAQPKAGGSVGASLNKQRSQEGVLLTKVLWRRPVTSSQKQVFGGQKGVLSLTFRGGVP